MKKLNGGSMKHLLLFVIVVLGAGLLGCQNSDEADQLLSDIVPTSSPVQGTVGPETPNFNLEVILRDSSGGNGFGLVKFRQPNDDEFVVNLDTWVRNLAPNTNYRLQRAVDTTLDNVCSSTAWLTLGK